MSPRRMPWVLLPRCLAIALLLLLAAPASGRVTGEMRIDEKTIPLTHVYAREIWQIPPKSPDDLIGPYVSVTITDREVAPEVLASDDLSWRDVQQHLVQSVTVVLNPLNGEVRDILYTFQVDTDDHPRVEGARGDWLSKFIETIDFDYDGQLLTATLKSLDPESIGVDLDVSFATPVVQAPRIIAFLEGDEARHSEPAQAYLRYFESFAPEFERQIELVALMKCGNQNSSCLESTRREMLATMPSPEDQLRAIQGIVLLENRAVIWLRSVSGAAKSEGTFELIKENGVWVSARKVKN